MLLTKPEEDIANRKLQISLCGTGASLQFQMRDLTSHRAALHIKTRRLKLLFVGGGGGGGSGGWLWICCGGAHTNVLAGRTLASCQILLIGAAEKVTLGGGKKNNGGKYNEPRLCCEKVSTGSCFFTFSQNLRPRVQLVRTAQFSSSRPRSRLRSAAGVLAACSQEANANCQFAAQQFPLTDSSPRACSGNDDCHSEGSLRQNGPQQHCTPAWKCIRIA